MKRTMSITIEAQVDWEAPDDADVGDDYDQQHKLKVIREIELCLVSMLMADNPEKIIRDISYLTVY